jgi:hypothetical protein
MINVGDIIERRGEQFLVEQTRPFDHGTVEENTQSMRMLGTNITINSTTYRGVFGPDDREVTIQNRDGSCVRCAIRPYGVLWDHLRE